MAKLIKLKPNIFYSDIKTGLNLFVECLGFSILYSDKETEHPFYIIARDEVTLFLIEDAVFALKDRPEVRMETDDIEALHKEVLKNNASLLHPNLSAIKQQPWGFLEFALKDKEGTCVILQQKNEYKGL